MGEIHKLNADLNIITKLDDEPNNTPTDGGGEPLSAEEFKQKFDEAGNTIKDYINTKLIPTIVAENIPFASSSGNIKANTVLEALEQLKRDQVEAALGNIQAGSIEEEKLDDKVIKKLNSSEPIVSADTPSGDYPIGKLWLRTESGRATDDVKEIYVQIAKGSWYAYTFDVLPIGRGGTGKSTIGAGSLLYGKNGAYEELEKPEEDSFLMSGTKPSWQSPDAVKGKLGYLTTATGKYTGSKTQSEVLLIPDDVEGKTDPTNAISPKFICVYRDDGPYKYRSELVESSVMLCAGATAAAYFFPTTGEYFSAIKLDGNKLVFSPTGKDDQFMNKAGDSYTWMALY